MSPSILAAASIRQAPRAFALAGALAFAATPGLAQTPSSRLVTLCTGAGATLAVIPADEDEDVPPAHAKPGCGHALGSRGPLKRPRLRHG
jgi:hypothetical protein